ncbi:hypothetical protein KI387_030920, partial [Taxus chinensis]
LLAQLNRVSKENQKLMFMIKIMSRNYQNLQKQLVEQQDDFKRFSLKSMAKTLKLGTDIEQDSIDKRSTPEDYSSALSDSSEDKNCKSSDMDDLQLMLPCKKRKANYLVDRNENGNESSLNKKAHVAVAPGQKKIITLRTKSEATVVSDGCQWRKYGQKNTRNNQWPRAYFRCAVTACPVKKQVQRCAEDPSMLSTIYEGEHNHLLSPVAMGIMNASSNHELQFPASIARISSMGSSPTITLDLTNNHVPNDDGLHIDSLQKRSNPLYNRNMQGSDGYSQLLPDQSTSSKVDPNYTAALAVAVAASIIKMGTTVQTMNTQYYSKDFIRNTQELFPK